MRIALEELLDAALARLVRRVGEGRSERFISTALGLRLLMAVGSAVIWADELLALLTDPQSRVEWRERRRRAKAVKAFLKLHPGRTEDDIDFYDWTDPKHPRFHLREW